MAKQIESYHDLLEYVESCLLTMSPVDFFELGESLDYKIKISGPSWDGFTDYRLAKYIVDFQKAIDKLSKEMGIEIDKEDKPVIKFKVEDGSLELFVKLTEAVAKIFDRMNGNQKVLTAIVSIGVITGGYTYNGITNRSHELEMQSQKLQYELKTKELEGSERKAQLEKDLKQTELLEDVFKSVVDKLPDYSGHHRILISNLKEGDVVESSIDSKKRTRKELVKEYPKKAKIKAETVYIDGTYIITAVKIKENKITIETGNHRFDCIPSLTLPEVDDLYSRMKAAHNKGHGIEIGLRITAEYYKGSNTLKNLNIYEISDQPRNGAKTVNELIGLGI